MMNENSPICASPIPTFSDVRGSLPATNVPSAQVTTFPTTTAAVITAIGIAYYHSTFGSINIPIATKNTALKMSRMPSNVRSTWCRCIVSATIVPRRNAPSASE